MKFDSRCVRGQLIINLQEQQNIQAENAHEFKQLLKKYLQKGHYRVVLNCEKIDFIDSSGLGALVGCLKVALLNNGWLKLINVSEQVGHIFELIKLNKIVPIYTSLNDALETG